MHIMQLLSGGGTNGAIAHCLMLSRELARRGHQLTLVCRENAWIAKQLADEDITVIESEMTRLPTTELRRIASIAQDTHVDVIHSHMSRAHFFGVLLKWRTGIPVVATAHNRHFQLHWMFNDHVIANSDSTLNYHRRYNLVSRRRSETIHCFIDVARFAGLDQSQVQQTRQDLGITEGELLVGIVGDVIARKGQIYLIKALSQIVKAIPQAKLAIIGNTNSDAKYVANLHKTIDELQLAEHVIWTGYRADVPQLMSALDICVAASLEEPQGLTVLEAAAAGTPVVASRTGGLPECVAEGITGDLVRTADSSDLASTIVELWQDKQRYQKYATAGPQHVAEHFSPESQTAQVDAVLTRVAGKPLAIKRAA
jgi:glycosyltransferase involved in cell wall biosynthesis